MNYLWTMSMKKISNYINGRSTAPVSGNYLDNYEPATGKIYSHIPDSDQEDVELAIQAAKNALPLWKALSMRERSNYMLAIADRIKKGLKNWHWPRPKTMENR